ncbi:glycoside hydrolase N-terminal domain-containing protein [Micromonospora sp. NPDC007230]|uniref:glycosyl hydrolase family 95 catalytic domain-containing protein n=1 Tax=Micromonospora sp. NPDC007230 TaxID=3364237 RepID=UPI00368D5545
MTHAPPLTTSPPARRPASRVAALAATLAAALLACTGLAHASTASAEESTSFLTGTESKALKLWYDEPAADSNDGWVDSSIPMGNGYMGANLFGGTKTDRIQITENSTQDSNNTIGGLNSFAEVYIDFNHNETNKYRRELALNEGVSRVQYEHDGVEYSREYFTSYPDKVMVVRLRASDAEKLSFTLRPTIPYLTEYRQQPGDNRGKSGTVVAKDDTVTLSGVMQYYNLQFEGQFKVVPDGGTMQAHNDGANDNGTISVSGANSAVILIAVGTNYRLDSQVISAENRLDKLKGFPHPHAKVTKYLADASAKSYDELLAAHQADYTELYDRVNFDLGSQVPAAPTDELIDAYRNGDSNPYLEELAFQFGRYLLICSSRAGTLPPNLQGIWNAYQDPPWRSGYWHNVNLQMNYWPAFSTNMPELFESYIGYYNTYLPRQKKYATQYIERYNPSQLDPGGDNGWSMGNSTWPYNGSGKSSHSGFGTGAWTAMLFWDYYDYTRDKKLLEDVVYPAMYGQANFLSRFVRAHDGYLLADPSASPENADSLQSIGTTFDQQMIYENHRNTLMAAEVLGRSDNVLDKLRGQLPLLDPIKIGKSGQIKEYREEEYYGDIGDPAHRHISHLLGLYPGQLINALTPAWRDAAKVSLTKRGRVGGTGWAQAERIGTWARAGNGDEAYYFYNYLIKKHLMHNLFNNHRDSYTNKLFQVDGNFGATAGVSEMLLQSNDYVVAPLPALPKTWADGSYRGMLARGNFEVSARWSGGQADQFDILSKAGGPLTLRYANIKDAVVKTSDGQDVSFVAKGRDQIRLETAKGQTYVITSIPAEKPVSAPSDLKIDFDLKDMVKLSWTGSDDAATYSIFRAVGSVPEYELVASDITKTSFIYQSADLEKIDQATFRVTAVASDGRESDGATTVRLLPDEANMRALRIDGDVIPLDSGDGEKDGLSAAEGSYTVGITWRSGLLTEIRLASSTDGVATLRNEMFSAPVRVYRADGRPADHRIDGDTLTLPTRAGQEYRIVAQAAVTVDEPAATQLPNSSVPMSVTLRAEDQLTMPATRVRLEVPADWRTDPESVSLKPIRPGGSAAAKFTVNIPAGTPDGRYELTAVVASDEWSIQVPVQVEVFWPNLARGKPATQSSLRSGGVPVRAVDGNTNGVWSGGSVTHTEFTDQPWWQVDLGRSEQIAQIRIWGRTDCCVDRLSDYYVLVSDEPFVSGSLDEVLAQPGVRAYHEANPPRPVAHIDVGRTGRYVRVQLAGNNALSLAEVQVFPGRP